MVLSTPTTQYPTGDGQPVAESYVHFWAIATIAQVLTQYMETQPTPDSPAWAQAMPKPRYREHPGTVLANQFLYYAQGYPRLRVAPDVMVIFDVQSGGRDSYKIWEEKEVPAVIFEVTSAKTQEQDQYSKRDLYEQMGVEEYWLFDPKGEWIPEQLRGYRLSGEAYVLNQEKISHQLGLRLEVAGALLNFYRLSDGEKLRTLSEVTEQAAFERQRAERLAQRLRELGVEPEEP
ncbi:Uma2 family endonuclease [Anthocerotibacter panamensis]|uniref:Uma2 family endonuclease n=1 Tax=Anthocerotibacter panamensis TaxID=2857077 RepID=UPI001C4017A9|nr:Uma2 family endonuclease [Anthocerotibacter panamensis]